MTPSAWRPLKDAPKNRRQYAARYAVGTCRAHASLWGPANLLEVYEATKAHSLKGGWVQ